MSLDKNGIFSVIKKYLLAIYKNNNNNKNALLRANGFQKKRERQGSCNVNE